MFSAFRALHLVGIVTCLLGTVVCEPVSAGILRRPVLRSVNFEQNEGQTAAAVRFIARAPGYTLLLTDTQAVLLLRGPDSKLQQRQSSVIRMAFRGAHANEMVGEHKLQEVSHYLIGADASRWHTNVSHFERVRYRNLYPGIDLVFHDARGRLEYDFIVKPGADPNRIRLAFTGASPQVSANGDLVLQTATGQFLQWKPNLMVSGAQRHGTGAYRRLGNNEVGLVVPGYDHTRTLTIDPVLAYSTYLGGSGDDFALGVAVDGKGHAYVAGSTTSVNFPTVAALDATCGTDGHCNATSTSSGLPDAFVAKFNTTGTGLLYSTFLGGESLDVALGIEVDSGGNAYVTGFSNSQNFPGVFLGPGKGSGRDHAFVVKLSSNGSSILYAARFGGDTEGTAIALDSTRHAYITGHNSATDFPTTAGAFQRSGFGIFVTKLNIAGNGFVYSTIVAGPGFQFGHAIAVDGAGNAYVSGECEFANCPTTPGSFQPLNPHPNNGNSTAYVLKLNAAGSALVYATHLGGTAEEAAHGIAVDGLGNAYVSGFTASADFPTTPGVIRRSLSGFFAAFVTKLNPQGSGLVYSTLLGGSGGEGAGQVKVDGLGQAMVAGFTSSADFPTTRNAFQRVIGGMQDTFVSKLNASGTGFSYSSFLGGNGDDAATPGVALKNGIGYVTGETQSTNFPVTRGAFQSDNRGGVHDIFLVRVSPLCALSTAVTICTPQNGATLRSPVKIVAGTNVAAPVKLTQVYIDGAKAYEAGQSAIEATLPLALGSHRLTVQAFDINNNIIKQTIFIAVAP